MCINYGQWFHFLSIASISLLGTMQIATGMEAASCMQQAGPTDESTTVKRFRPHGKGFTDEELVRRAENESGRLSFHLRSTAVTDAGLAAISGNEKIEELYLQRNDKLTAAGVAAIRLPKLRRLTLEDFVIDRQLLEEIVQNPSLSGLVLKKCTIDIEHGDEKIPMPRIGVLEVEEVAGLTSLLRGVAFNGELKWLQIRDCEISKDLMQAICQIESLERLYFLGGEEHAAVRNEWLPLLTELKNLEYLNIFMHSEDGIKLLAEIPKLKYLTLSGPITDRSVPVLIEFKKVKSLNVMFTAISEEGVAQLLKSGLYVETKF